MKVETNKYQGRIWDYHGHESNYEFESPNDYEAYQKMLGNGFGNYGHDDCLWRVEKDGTLVDIDTKTIKPMEIKYTMTSDEVQQTIQLVKSLNFVINTMKGRSLHFQEVLDNIFERQVKLSDDELKFLDKLCKMKRLEKSTFKIENT